MRQTDTDVTAHDTGAFGSAGTVVAGRAVHEAATAPAGASCAPAAAARTGEPSARTGSRDRDGLRRGRTLLPFADLVGPAGELRAEGRCDGAVRSLAFNVQGFRVAVDTATGEVVILQSVQAADAGFVMNPQQCRGQVEGGVVQAIGDGAVRGDDPRRTGG